MVIDPGNNINVNGGANKSRQSPVNGTKEATASTSEAQAEPKTGKDSVSISVEGKSLAQIEASIASAPDVDLAKVDAVKQAIADGSYQTNSEAIAQGMIKEGGL